MDGNQNPDGFALARAMNLLVHDESVKPPYVDCHLCLSTSLMVETTMEKLNSAGFVLAQASNW